MKTLNNNNLKLQPAWVNNDLSKITTIHTEPLKKREKNKLGCLEPVGNSSYRRWGCLDFWECWSEMRLPMATWIDLKAVATPRQAIQS